MIGRTNSRTVESFFRIMQAARPRWVAFECTFRLTDLHSCVVGYWVLTRGMQNVTLFVLGRVGWLPAHRYLLLYFLA
jgi:hypothetical protein